MTSKSFTSNLIENSLASPERYSPARPTVFITPKSQPKTPLGENWKFKGCSLPADYILYADRIKNFEVRPDDVWVISFPKSGTTWTLEMAWLLINGCDFQKSKSLSHFVKAPFLE